MLESGCEAGCSQGGCWRAVAIVLGYLKVLSREYRCLKEVLDDGNPARCRKNVMYRGSKVKNGGEVVRSLVFNYSGGVNE